jgi:hypothetical protein
MGCLQVSNTGKGRCLSFRLQRESLDLEGVKLFEKKEETIPSFPSAVHRETFTNPVDHVAPADDSQRHCSRPGKACMGSTDSVGGRETCNSS